LVRLKILSGKEVCSILSEHGFLEIRRKKVMYSCRKKFLTVPSQSQYRITKS
jgi:predicted RNA binding protein YcfA (HicA-like mRNA interferase family)